MDLGAEMSDSDQRTELLLAFFTERGYQPILIARSDLIPPDIYLLGEGRYRRLGPLRELLKHQSHLPEPQIGTVPELEKVETRSREAALSFAFFSQILERCGLTGSPKGTAKANLAGDVILRFQDVTVKEVSPTAIEAALNIGLDTKKLDNDRIEKGIVHVAYEYLYSSRVEIILGNRSHVSIGLSAGLANAAEAKADGSSRQEGVDATSYQAKDKPVAVAFKAAQLVRDGSNWRLRLMRSSAAGIGPREAIRTPYVFNPNAILTIEDDGI